MTSINDEIKMMKKYLEDLDNGGSICYPLFEQEVRMILKHLENDL